MTNQVNQAFMEFYNKNKHLYTDTSPYGIMLTTFQAATQASDSEINSLKHQVNVLEKTLANQSMELAHDIVTIESYSHKVTALQADNERLREALETARGYQFDAVNQFHSDFAGYKEDKHKQYDADLANTDKALASTPEKSLAEHDNEVVAPYKKALEFAEYMAKSTEQFMIAINQLDEADQEEDEETIEIMQEKRGEHWRAVNSSIYEFRQRSDRALKATP